MDEDRNQLFISYDHAVDVINILTKQLIHTIGNLYPNSMTIHQNELFICDYGNARIQIFNTVCYTYKSAIKFTQFKVPHSITITPIGTFIKCVSDKYIRGLAFGMRGLYALNYYNYCVDIFN